MEKKKTKVNYSMSEDLEIKPWGEFTVEFQRREEDVEEGGDSPEEKDWNQELVNRFQEALSRQFTPALAIPGRTGTIKYVLHKGAEAKLYFHLMAETMNALAAEMNQESARLKKQAEEDLREAEKWENLPGTMKNFENQ